MSPIDPLTLAAMAAILSVTAAIAAGIPARRDTQVVLWWQRDDRRLNRAARTAIATADVVWVSAISAWEVAIKVALGRLRLTEPFRVLLRADDFTELPLTVAHAEARVALPAHHTDPFDRVLVAQARVEGATIVSHDRALKPYKVPTIWT